MILQVKKGASTADIIIDFPLLPTVETGIRVVEVQAKTRESQDDAIPLKVLRDDCCRKARPNAIGDTLAVFFG